MRKNLTVSDTRFYKPDERSFNICYVCYRWWYSDRDRILIDGFAVDLNSLPFEERSNFGTITPLAAMFKSIGGVAFGFMLPILAGFIAMSIADRPGLAVGFVGGAIAANGTSGFLGALMVVCCRLSVRLLKKLFEKLPEGLEGCQTNASLSSHWYLLIGAIMTYIVSLRSEH